ncbi:ion transporter [Natronorubrum sp. DTA7]|uniref:ion transporter n=1 Tax=Natronorubrum sp. DTA7 TaxID=3447016 RepID=UPI003F845E6A
MPYLEIRKQVFELLDADQGGRPGQAIDLFIMALILLSVVTIILETVDPIAQQYGDLFQYFEVVSVAIFTLEYSLRIWSITTHEGYSAINGRLKYATNPYMIIDLLAILPFFLGGIVDLRFLRVIRLFRVFRVFKLARYSTSIQTMGHVLKTKKPDLVISVVVTAILLVLASSSIYYVEHQAQPEEFSSIPAAFWWAVVTMTTVGYGDVTPVTQTGQLLGGVVAFLGIGLFALPASILASGFIEEATTDEANGETVQYDENDITHYNHCPHCGDELPHEQGIVPESRGSEHTGESERATLGRE